MAKNLNRVFLVGNLCADPEMKATTSGTTLCKFRIANNRDYGEKKHVNFFSCTAFGKLAEVCQKYLAKGRQVLVEGTVDLRQYEKDGDKRTATEITCNEVHFLGGGNSDNAPATTSDVDDAEIPF